MTHSVLINSLTFINWKRDFEKRFDACCVLQLVKYMLVVAFINDIRHCDGFRIFDTQTSPSSLKNAIADDV